MSKRTDKPFAKLGAKLKLLRERSHESLEDASGAVEIDAPTLQAYEEGLERPAEDILHVLLHHFDVNEDTASELWQMAGYRDTRQSSFDEFSDRGDTPGSKFQPTPAMLVLPIDARILYSDSVQVHVNEQGVVLEFMQYVGPDNKHVPVSRIGMSKDHAQTMVNLLSDCLANTKPKQLPGQNPIDKDEQR